MTTIWKYPLEIGDMQKLSMPQDAKIISVQLQGGAGLCAWALVDTDRPNVIRYIRVAGTGHAITQRIIAFLGTFQMQGGALVFHVLEVSA